MRIHILRLALLVSIPAFPLASQSTSELVEQARARMSTTEFDSAATLLTTALSHATQRPDTVSVLTWRAILAFMKGDEQETRTEFHEALQLDSGLQVQGLYETSPRLARLFYEERVGLLPNVVFTSNEVDEMPRRLSGPPIAYPPELLRRQVRGRAMVGLTVDTLGHAVERTIDILATPDSGFDAPLRAMLLASTFSPGRRSGRAVRTMIELAIDLVPGTPPSATSYVNAARAQLALHHVDSALVLTRIAIDPATRATEGEGVYARLVQGIALAAAGRDSLARLTLDSALAGYTHLTGRGVDLAPFVKRLADSVRLGRSGHKSGELGTPAVVEPVDAAPIPVSHPAIVYPPEMQALRVGGTVVVEARVDATGHVLAGTVRVVQSPNPGLEHAAMKVVTGAVYKPARRGGHAVAVTIRQPITFAPY